MFLRDCMLECIISTISRSFVLVIKYPGSSLEQTLKLLILSVLQYLSNMAKNAVNLEHKWGVIRHIIFFSEQTKCTDIRHHNTVTE